MKKLSVSEWHKLFKEGHMNMEDDERSDYPGSYRTDENVEKYRIRCIQTFRYQSCGCATTFRKRNSKKY